MSTFYAEIHRQDALERIELKQGKPLPQILPQPLSLVTQNTRKQRRPKLNKYGIEESLESQKEARRSTKGQLPHANPTVMVWA